MSNKEVGIYLIDKKKFKEDQLWKVNRKIKNFSKNFYIKRSTLITVFSQFFKNGWTHWKINI